MGLEALAKPAMGAQGRPPLSRAIWSNSGVVESWSRVRIILIVGHKSAAAHLAEGQPMVIAAPLKLTGDKPWRLSAALYT